MNQSILFKTTGLPLLSVTVILTSLIIFVFVGEKFALFGSKLKGYLLVKSSLGIKANVLDLFPSV